MTVMPCGACGEYVQDNLIGTQCKKCGWKVGDAVVIAAVSSATFSTLDRVKSFTYAVEQRLRFIDFLLNQYGSLNRSAIMDYFGVSEPCASRDIQQYIELAPDNIVYDNKAKAYIRGINFKRAWA